MTLRDKLLDMEKEAKYQSPERIYSDGVNTKLTRSQKNYENNIEENCKYILSRSNYKAMMAMDRYSKWKENRKDGKEDEYGFIEVIKP